VVIANHNLELLLADSVGLRPVLVIFPAHSHATHDQQVPAKSNGGDALQDFAVDDDPLELLQHSGAYEG